jgi:hypothetical protein
MSLWIGLLFMNLLRRMGTTCNFHYFILFFISKYIFISRKTFTIRLMAPDAYYVINWILSNLGICVAMFLKHEDTL